MSRRISLSDIEIEVLEKLVEDSIGKNAKWVDHVVSVDFKKKLLLKLAAQTNKQ